MREIKFRGKIVTTDSWVYGHYAFVDGYHVIYEDGKPLIIKLNKLGQYTGLKDKNGREIYEGDVIHYTKVIYADCTREEIEDVKDPVIGKFYYAEGLYPGIQFKDGTGSLFLPGTIDSDEFEVIGNIHENPELLGDDK